MLPRQVLPRQFYLVTRRCTQRQFLLRPDPETNNAFTYALIDAAQRAQIAADRQRTGTRVYGRRAVLRQAWWDRPASFEPRRNLRPRVAARCQWARIEALRRNQDFVEDYAAARQAWRAGAAVTFPAGTYWLRRNARVLIAAT